MIVYLDSSVILSIIFQESTIEKSIDIWKSSEIRVSSILLEAECKINIKRTYLHNKSKLSETWKKEKLDELDKLTDEINFKNIDNMTLEILSKEEILSGCRTLDALHLSTAIEFRKELVENFYVFSYDNEFNQIAKFLKFNTL